MKMPHLNKQAFILAILVAVITSSPYLYGYLTQKPGQHFLARSQVNSADTYALIANIESSKQGKLLLPNLYTTESKEPFMIRPTYQILGFLANIFNLDTLFIFHLSKFILSIVFALILWKFITLTTPENNSLLALTTVLFSSGLGFFAQQILPSSIDLWVPEANTFFTLLESPHFISAQIFLLSAVYLLYKYLIEPSRFYLLTSSLFFSLLILEHPFMAPFVFVYPVVIFFLTDQRSFKEKRIDLISYLIAPTLITGLVYYFFSSSLSAKIMNSQNILLTPDLVSVLSGFGLLLVFSFLGFKSKGLRPIFYQLLFIWIVLDLLLIYGPFSFQRRLLEGLHIPMAITASAGVIYFTNKIQSKIKKYLVGTFILILLSVTSIYNLYSMFQVMGQNNEKSYIYHLSSSEYKGMQKLKDITKDGDVILANFYYSNIIPGITGRFVFSGHTIQSYKYKEKAALLHNFLQTDSNDYRQRFLKANKINYIFLGKDDLINESFSGLIKEKILEEVSTEGEVFIYKVTSKLI